MKEQELEPKRLSKWRKPTRAIRYVEDQGCWICTSHKPSLAGYPRIRIDKRLIQLHRYVYTNYVGSIPEGFCVMHLCDNKLCINPKHLKAATLAENTLDGWGKGLYPQNINKVKGEKQHLHKLTEEAVRLIRRSSESSPKLAKRFGVAPVTIGHVKRGNTWKHVK